jgi:hypothetical protein
MANSHLLRPATLDRTGDLVDDTVGVHMGHFPPLTTLLVWTTMSLYRVVVTHWPEVYVHGDGSSSDPALTDVDGACYEEGCLRVGWISAGLFVEICAGGRHLITSPVLAITTERASSPNVH